MNWSEATTVFLGDSITEGYGVLAGDCWVDAMPGRYINCGISGDTTTGMRKRFDAHVLRRNPDRVVIMGGINDLSEGHRMETVIDNLCDMYDRAREQGIVVVPAICVNPDYNELLCNDWVSALSGIRNLPEQLLALAAWIRAYADQHRCTCLDFPQEFEKYTSDGYCRYFFDGVHPNERGHAIMACIARAVLYPEQDGAHL